MLVFRIVVALVSSYLRIYIQGWVVLFATIMYVYKQHYRFISEKLGEKDVQGADEGTDLPDFDATSFSLSQPFNDAKHCAVAPKDATSEETSVLVDDIHDFSDAEDW